MPTPSLNSDATGYDPNNALLMARASALVYSPDESLIRSTLKTWGFRRFRMVSVGSTQLFLAGNDKALLLALRGTEMNLEDWLSDAKVRLTGGPWGGMIHEGFGLALGSVWAQVLEAIKDFQDNGQGLWITGHSLGAALATLAAAKFLEKPEQIPGLQTKLRALYTFGSPRVGTGSFTTKFDELFKECTFRFVNNRDIVTRVAPRTLLGYEHVGHVYYIDENGALNVDPSNWDMILEAAKSVIPFFKQIEGRNLNAIQDHSIDGYARKIEAQIQKLGT